MARIKVPQPDGQIVHFDGSESVVYKVKDGAVAVDDAHAAALLASVPGSELVQEAPAKAEAPPKEK